MLRTFLRVARQDEVHIRSTCRLLRPICDGRALRDGRDTRNGGIDLLLLQKLLLQERNKFMPRHYSAMSVSNSSYYRHPELTLILRAAQDTLDFEGVLISSSASLRARIYDKPAIEVPSGRTKPAEDRLTECLHGSRSLGGSQSHRLRCSSRI